MTIASEIQRIKTNIENAYDALENLGATMPATEDTDHLVSTIQTVSGDGQTQIKTVTNATGSAVSSGDKVWVNGNQIVDYIDVDTVSGIAKDNFTAGTQIEQLTVTGSLTNSDGILSGFSASNYAVLDDKGTLPSFEILTKININHTDYYGSVLDNAFHFIRVGGGKIGIYNATDGSIANFSFSINKWYWCNGVYDGTSYTLYCLEDNGFDESQLPPLSAWDIAATTQNVSGINLDSIYLGVDGGYLPNYFHGTINIEATKITSNGAIIWRYNKYVNGGSGKVLVLATE